MRDKARFLFPFTVVAVGVALVVALVGFMEGVFMGMIDMTANLDSGHLRLVNKAFYDEEHLRPLDRSLANQQETHDWLVKHSSMQVDWAPRIRWGAILDVPDEKGETRSQTPVMGMAMDLKSPNSREIERLRLKSSLVEGDLPKGFNEMLMGVQLAEVLGISVGQSVTLMGQSFDGGMVADNYQVSGLVRFGVSAMDKKMVLIDLVDAQNTFYMEDMVTDWLGYFPPSTDLDDYEELKESMRTGLADWIPHPKDWAKDDAPIILSIRDQQNIGAIMDKFRVIKGFVVGIFTFLMVLVLWNAGILSGIHRYGEMGLRLAFGEPHWRLILTLAIEGLWIGFLGSVAGSLVGGSFAWYLQEVGLNMGDSFAQSGLMINDVVRARVTTDGFVQGIVPGIFASVAGTLVASMAIFQRSEANLFRELEAG
ncbi:MAG: ABC transporter permease [Nitrospinae bacterium]|nr:ABC transporter permease [Nitrospinota bacterium]MBL7019871.1 ABC transporter permease [Nitrospinaceae bacterium]